MHLRYLNIYVKSQKLNGKTIQQTLSCRVCKVRDMEDRDEAVADKIVALKVDYKKAGHKISASILLEHTLDKKIKTKKI